MCIFMFSSFNLQKTSYYISSETSTRSSLFFNSLATLGTLDLFLPNMFLLLQWSSGTKDFFLSWRFLNFNNTLTLITNCNITICLVLSEVIWKKNTSTCLKRSMEGNTGWNESMIAYFYQLLECLYSHYLILQSNTPLYSKKYMSAVICTSW